MSNRLNWTVPYIVEYDGEYYIKGSSLSVPMVMYEFSLVNANFYKLCELFPDITSTQLRAALAFYKESGIW